MLPWPESVIHHFKKSSLHNKHVVIEFSKSVYVLEMNDMQFKNLYLNIPSNYFHSQSILLFESFCVNFFSFDEVNVFSQNF